MTIRFFSALMLVLLLVCCITLPVGAQTNDPPEEDPCGDFGCFEVLDQLPTGDSSTSIGKSIAAFVRRDSPLVTIANIFFQIGIVLVVLIGLILIVFGGYVYMTAGGNASQISAAKGYIGSALAGIVLALVGWLLLSTLSPQFTNPTEPTLRIPPQQTK